MELPSPTCRPDESTRPFFSPFLTKARRFFFFGTVFVINLLATLWLADLIYREGTHKAHLLLLTIFALLNGLLVLGSGHAIIGALDILIHGRRSVRISKLAEGMEGPLTKRFAIVMPVYNEDSHRFCARIEAIYRSLEETGRLESFDFFILSDTRDPDLWVLEETAWTNLCRRLEAFGRIYYRRRKVNLNRKAGNIGDFVRTWGGGYEAMAVTS
jgi:membrane glycosyltransferase